MLLESFLKISAIFVYKLACSSSVTIRLACLQCRLTLFNHSRMIRVFKSGITTMHTITVIYAWTAFINMQTGPGPGGPKIFLNLRSSEQNLINLESDVDCDVVLELSFADKTMISVFDNSN